MDARAALQTFVLGRIRRHAPRLLGARRRSFRDARGRVTPYLELGRGPETLVFLHGFSDRPENFLGAAAVLRKRYRLLIPAMPAFGEGWVDRAEAHSFEAYADWIGEVLAGIAPARFHLVGNSLGGATALGVAARLPERVASLVLADHAGVKAPGVSCLFDEFEDGPNPFEVHTMEDFERFLAKVSRRPEALLALFGRALFEEARTNADWYVRIGKDLGRSVRGFVEAGKDSFVDLASIRVPTLVVFGQHDPFFPPAIGEHVARRMPDARFELLPWAGHCPHLDDPARFAGVVEAFTRTHPA